MLSCPLHFDFDCPLKFDLYKVLYISMLKYTLNSDRETSFPNRLYKFIYIQISRIVFSLDLKITSNL